MSHYPTDETKTGREIAMSVLTTRVGMPQARSLLDDLTAHRYPLEVIQKGHLTRLLDEVDHLIAEKSELQEIVRSLREQMDDTARNDLAVRVLEFCKISQRAGKSALETAQNASSRFSDPGELGLVTPVQSGESVEIKIPHGPYIAFDENKNTWNAQQTSLFDS